jgi:hypothetical protein
MFIERIAVQDDRGSADLLRWELTAARSGTDRKKDRHPAIPDGGLIELL